MNNMILSKAINIISGGTPKTSVPQYWDGNIGWLSVVDFGNVNKYVYSSEKQITEEGLSNSTTKLLQKDDIIMSARGTVGAMAKIGTPMAFNQSCFGLRAKPELLNQDFLYYYLKNYMGNIQKKSQGSVFSTINLSTFDNIEISVPELKEQEKIAKLLDAIDSKIENNTRINSTLESLAKTIYDYWFLQYEFPNEDGKPYKSSGGKMVYNEELKREIPEGWEVKKLKDCVSDEKNAIVDGPFGTQLKIGEYVDDGVPIYEMELLNGLFITSPPKHFITEEKYEEVKRSAVKNGDIIISKTGTLGLVGIVNSETYDKGIIVSRLAKITPNNKTLGKYTLLMYLKELTDSGYWLQKAGGSTMPILNNTILENVPIILPNKNLFNIYEEKVESIYDQIYLLQKENQRLTALRDFLLPLLMNGQAKVE